MVTQIRHKLLNIPVMLVNFVNSRAFNSEVLHQFSSCHKARVRYKKVCENCDKSLTSSDILKGTDEKHILTEEQQDRLKEQLDNQTIEILSFEQETEQNNILKSMLLIQKSMLVLPSISKGFKHKDLNIFESFKDALKELEIFCRVKYITRGKEHIGIIKIIGEDLIFVELPFFSRLNHEEISRLKEGVERESPRAELKNFAIDYIKQNIKILDYQTITEKKAILIKQYLENAISGEVEQEQEVEINNPFLTK